MLAGTVVTLLIPPFLIMLTRSRAALPAVRGITARQVFTACSATLAMLAVSYADLLLARHLLSADASGGYAVGTVLTKGAIWAPQVVTVLALPRLAQGNRRALGVAVALVAGCGASLVTASALAGGLAFRLAGGAEYVHLGGYAPVFAATGALYALLFVLVNAQVAAGARWPSAPLWASAAGLVVAAEWLLPRTFTAIMWAALVTAAAALALTAVAIRRRAGRPEHVAGSAGRRARPTRPRPRARPTRMAGAPGRLGRAGEPGPSGPTVARTPAVASVRSDPRP